MTITTKARRLFAAALCTSTLLTAPAFAFDDAEKAEIGQIVREYLLANPELMIEIQGELERKQEEQAAAARIQIITDNADALFKNGNDPVLGNPDGDVTVVEFFDYNCSFCRRALSDMTSIMENDKNVRFVLKEFPILSDDSRDAHQVALAFNALAPEKYVDFHLTLMKHEGIVNGELALQTALDLGVEEAALREKMQDPANMDHLRDTFRVAELLGITGTPSYVIGDGLVPGALGQEALMARIEEQRKKSQ